jgi:uncharacterized protein YehS (DUF1456 family)
MDKRRQNLKTLLYGELNSINPEYMANLAAEAREIYRQQEDKYLRKFLAISTTFFLGMLLGIII